MVLEQLPWWELLQVFTCVEEIDPNHRLKMRTSIPLDLCRPWTVMRMRLLVVRSLPRNWTAIAMPEEIHLQSIISRESTEGNLMS